MLGLCLARRKKTKIIIDKNVCVIQAFWAGNAMRETNAMKVNDAPPPMMSG